PAFEDIVLVFKEDIRHSAAEKFTEQLMEVYADGLESFREQAPAVLINLANDFLEGALGVPQIAKLGVERSGPAFKVAQFLQRIKIDAAEASQFAPQFRNFLIDRRSLHGNGRRAGTHLNLTVKVREIDLIIFAKPFNQRIAGVGHVIDDEFARMRLILLGPPGVLSGLGPAA